MSLPQIEDAFIRTRTCPWPGSGMGYSRNSTVLLPGKITPVMVAVAVLMSLLFRLFFSLKSRRSDLAASVPEVFPGLILSPEKDLALDQPAVPVDRRDLAHLIVRERLADNGFQAAQILISLHREGNRHLPALHGPLHADNTGMN